MSDDEIQKDSEVQKDTELPVDERASRARAERARLARVFGEVLPEATSDDRLDDGSRSSEWFERERPPHHY
ncbi:hypothetical protein [Rhodococcus sovatensis]|uniref:Uncharacterized protein n=1 Tax=Rhodococcus sovatensis TaxID=1805840 RepID=A0ABZ2PJG0_9NOCA